MNKYPAILAFFIMAGLCSSCAFTKVVKGKKAKDPDKKVVWTGADSGKAAEQAIAITTPGPVAHPEPAVTANPLIADLTPILKRRIKYKTFTGKAKMKFEGPDSKLDFTGHFRVKKDSAIWLQVSAIGGLIQAVRIFITPDSFYMLNYQQDEATVLPLSQADKFLPAKVDFNSLQNLIIGDPLREGTIADASSGGDSLVMRVEDTSFIQHIVYNRHDSTMRYSRLVTRKASGPEALTEYDGYFPSKNGKVSTNRIINLVNGKDTYRLEMNFTKIIFDEPVELPFSIPENYTVKR